MWFEMNRFKKLEYFEIICISYILTLYTAFIVRKELSDQENRKWEYKDPLGHDTNFMQQILYFLMYHSLGNTEQNVLEIHFGWSSIVDGVFFLLLNIYTKDDY